MDEKKRIKWKLNLFDISLLVIVLAIGGALVAWKMIDSRQTTVDPNTGVSVPKGMQMLTYKVELEQVYEQVTECIAVGDEVYGRIKKERMGTIQSVEVKPATTLTRNELEGTYQFAEVPERYNVILEITTQATENEDSFVLESGMELRAGDSAHVIGPGYYGVGYVMSVERG